MRTNVRAASRACFLGCGLALVAGCSAAPGPNDDESVVDNVGTSSQAVAAGFNLSRLGGRVVNPWPSGFVVYEFDPTVYFKDDTALKNVGFEMRKARDEIGRDTNFIFLEQKNAAVDHVYVKWTGGMQCAVPAGGISAIGKRGGNQELCLGTGIDTRTAIHESGHTLGLFHEQERRDRDTFITMTGSILTDEQWKIETGADPLGDFDGNSVMLYTSSQAPSGTYKWKNDTIAKQWNGPPASGQPVDRSIYAGAQRLSLGDIRGLQVMYGDQFDASAAFVKGGTGKTPAKYGIFYRNQSGGVSHIFQGSSSFQTKDIGGSIFGTPSAVFDGTNIIVFARSRVQGQNPKDGDLVACTVDPSTHNRVGDWINLGRPEGDSVNGSPVAVAGTDDVYVQGAQRKLYRYNPGLGVPIWEDVGGKDLKIAVDAVKQGSKTHVFGLRTVFNTRTCPSTDRYCDPAWPVASILTHRIRNSNGTWGAWTDVPDKGHVRGMVSAVSCTSTTVEVVAKGFYGDAFYQVWRDGTGWLPAWQPLGGAVVGTPVATCQGNMLIVAASSTDGNVYLTWGQGTPGPNRFQPWWGWINFTYPLYGAMGSPMVYSDGTNLDIMARNLNDDIFRRPTTGQPTQFDMISTVKAAW